MGYKIPESDYSFCLRIRYRYIQGRQWEKIIIRIQCPGASSKDRKNTLVRTLKEGHCKPPDSGK